jgi:hypothetical protein
MKGNNGTNRIPKTITKPPDVSLMEPGIPNCRLPWAFFKHELSPMEGQHI